MSLNFHKALITLTILYIYPLASFSQWAPQNLFHPDSLEKVNLDVRNDKYGKLSSLIIYEGNRIIYEKYYGFTQASTLHQISSVTKSFTSIAVGVALEKGFIPSLDTKIYLYYPEYLHIFEQDTLKKEITIFHLLNQTSGFKWDEWSIHYSYAGNPLIELSQKHTEWIPLIINLPLDSKPGELFNYNSASSELLKDIIVRSSCQTFHDFVFENILKKLSITKYHWDVYPENGEPAWGGLSLSSRDMAKIGLLILNNGKWQSEAIVSEAWIKQSVNPIVNTGELSYGLHWWITKQPNGKPLVFAAGYGDQYVYVIPDKNIVIAINAKNFTDYKWERNHKDLIFRILRAYNNTSYYKIN